jgi:hypothetical protein
MPKLIDLSGQKFGRLTVLHRVPNQGPEVRWACACDCGNRKELNGSHLKSGNTKSCGCWASDRAKTGIKRKHNRSGTPLYELWCKMRERCGNPSNPSYGAYGGRGIYVCDRWQDFENFFADMGERPSPKHSIDRIDNDGPYSPSNCRWVGSIREQRANCRDNRWITYKGETMILSEWARRTGIDGETIAARLDARWSVDDALTRPPWNQKSITYRGKTLTVVEWSRQTGINRRTIADRLSKGWSPSRILAKASVNSE